MLLLEPLDDVLVLRISDIGSTSAPAGGGDSNDITGISSVGVPTRGSGSQLVNAACFLVPDDDARGNTVTHGLS